MKQYEDNKTLDMWGKTKTPDMWGKTKTPDMLGETKTPASVRYRFYIELNTGEEVEWRRLSVSQAKQMYSYTAKHMPINVTRCGWEEI